MTNEERDLITRFIARVGGAPQQGAFGGGSVPATQPALPPVDHEADGLLADLFSRYPEARYRISQLAFVQEHALNQAQTRINQLQAELAQARAQAQAQPQPGASPWGQGAQQPQPQPSRGFFSGLFGGGSQPQQPPPQYQQPQYAPPPPQYAPNPGMFQRGGSGFLGSALTTAAGVAGGMVAGNALMNLFSGHTGGLGGLAGGQPQVVENVTEYVNQPSPWGNQGGDQFDQGGAQKDFQQDPAQDAGQFADNSGWTDAPPDQGAGWDTSSNDGGWTDTSGGNDDNLV